MRDQRQSDKAKPETWVQVVEALAIELGCSAFVTIVIFSTLGLAFWSLSFAVWESVFGAPSNPFAATNGLTLAIWLVGPLCCFGLWSSTTRFSVPLLSRFYEVQEWFRTGLWIILAAASLACFSIGPFIPVKLLPWPGGLSRGSDSSTEYDAGHPYIPSYMMTD